MFRKVRDRTARKLNRGRNRKWRGKRRGEKAWDFCLLPPPSPPPFCFDFGSALAPLYLLLYETQKNRQLRTLSKRLCSRVVSNAKRKQICAKWNGGWFNTLLPQSLRKSSSFRLARERASECLLSRAGRVCQLAMTPKRRAYSQAQWHNKEITRQTCFENVWPRLIVLFDEWRTLCNETAPIRQPFLTSRNNNKRSTIITHKCN